MLESLKKSFAYVFEENKYPGAPEWNIHLIDERPFFVEPGDEDRKLIWVHDRGYCWQTADGELIPTMTGRLRLPELLMIRLSREA